MIKNAVFTKLIKHTIATLLAVSLLSGCGFKLRGDYLLPEEFETLYVSSTDKHGELTRMVKQHLKVNEVNLETKGSATIPELRILNDSLDRRTLSLFENGQVAEYELTYTVRYEIRFSYDRPRYFQFELYRNYQDNPDRALAKSRELTLLRTEMRSEAANKILRNLATIKL
ncbi:MAG: LPS assembly lipoprotein LptE [Thalassotalea sp.]|nr:LPS assembly lipoprotein LptE [Thalassotalea sp.]MDG2393447.1 LPS assembly lipoprotein LptE [Thalassotalea sp.]